MSAFNPEEKLGVSDSSFHEIISSLPLSEYNGVGELLAVHAASINSSNFVYKLKYLCKFHLLFCILFFFLKDQLAADMYNFVSKEGEYAKFFVMVSIFFSMNLTAALMRRHSVLKDYILCAKPSSLMLCAHQKLMLFLFF